MLVKQENSRLERSSASKPVVYSKEELKRILAKIEHDDEPELAQINQVQLLLYSVSQLPLLFFQRSARRQQFVSETDRIDQDGLPEQSTKQNTGEKTRKKAQADQALKRDGNACVVTGRAHPEACHIFPFAGNNDISKLQRLDTELIIGYSYFFRDKHHKGVYRQLFADSPACSDKAWNIISLDGQLYEFWRRPYFGLRCLDLDTTSEPNHDTLTLEFRWVPWFHANDKGFWNQYIPLSDLRNEFDRFVKESEELAKIEDHDFLPEPDAPVINARLERGLHRGENVKTGHRFKIRLPKWPGVEHSSALTDGEKMKKAIDLQWKMVVLCSMAGGAGFREDDYDSDSEEEEEWE